MQGGYFRGFPPVRGTCFDRSSFERRAQRALTSFEAIAERSAFGTPRHLSLPSAAAFRFLRVGFFGFIRVWIVGSA